MAGIGKKVFKSGISRADHMILVIVGTERFSFDRLIKAVDRLIEEGVLRDEVVVQMGASVYQPRRAKFFKFVPFGEMSELISKASLVVAHAGAGTTLLSLQMGKPVILFPRMSRYFEHVDNHQVDFARKMKEAGRVLVAYDYDTLRLAVLNIGQISALALQRQELEIVTFLHGSLRRMEKINLCGVDIHNVSLGQTIQAFERLILARRPASVVTPNVDHIVKFQKDAEFRKVYEDAALVLADGVPILWAARFLGEPLREKVSGSDLFPKLCEVAAQKGWRLFFLGGREKAAAHAAEALLKRHPNLNVVGIYSPPHGFEKDDVKNAQIVAMIKEARPDILFIGLGAPKQEKWAQRFKDAYDVPVSIGIGASFDFVAGIVLRAPVWMQRVGLEWFWRLMMEPHRLWRRYLVDDLAFFGLVFDQKCQSRVLNKKPVQD